MDLLLAHALLPNGFAADIRLTIRDGLITHVAPYPRGAAADPGLRRVAGIALPGLPNLHSHAFQRGMAGLAERRGPEGDTFWTWREVMYRFLARLSPDDVEAIAALAYVEMLERGFTTVGEFHYLHNDVDGAPYADSAELACRIVAAAQRTGIGLTLLPCFYAQGGFGGAAPTEGQRRFVTDLDGYGRLVERCRTLTGGMAGARVGVAPHSLRAVTPDALREVIRIGAGGPIHIHAAEQVREVEDCLDWSGRRPVAWLLDEAGLDARWCLIHATHMTQEETGRLARTGATVGLCPLTESSLGDGIFEGPAYLGSGGAFGIGTDSNIEIDGPGELRQLEYAQRLARRGRNLMTRHEGESTGTRLVSEALSGGARALAQPIGAIAPGCPADIVVLDETHPGFAAAGPDTWLDCWLFSAGREAISTVIAGGRIVVEGGRHVAREAVAKRYRATMRRIMSQ